ncbi:MAG: TonB-dependent receptor [Bacteroidota bacterium]|nr:TonB-dependent receptor [Bacteroidota bacterium]
MRSFLFIVSLTWLTTTQGQITGTVYGVGPDGREALVGAQVYWEGSEVSTSTDANGAYSIEKPEGSTTLIATFIGHLPQKKIIISRKGTVDFELKVEGEVLGEVQVEGRSKETTIDVKRADLSFRIDDKELKKAACCNLSESFETNATVDISFSDAVTGTRQIEMLGLSGKYVLIQRENVPLVRGLNAVNGLSSIPGPFVSGLQLTKGLSSVLNGYESISGQINIDLWKPEDMPRFFVNGFLNQGARAELNVGASHQISNRLSTAALIHGSTIPIAMDRNGDGFSDMPIGDRFSFLNRWHYVPGSGWEGQVGVNVDLDRTESGQIGDLFDAESGRDPWTFRSTNQRFELFGKNGYVFKTKADRSFGSIYSISHQEKSATLGNRRLGSTQSSFYLNTIFQDELGSEKHLIRTGVSFQYDQVKEDLDSLSGRNLYSLDRTEWVPGVYLEYSWKPSDATTLVGGIRLDQNSLFGTILTPRIHLRQQIGRQTTFRIGGGRGQRTANVLSENISVLASSREVQFLGEPRFDREIGWNAGASISQMFLLFNSPGTIHIDAFHTWFEQKLITDLDAVFRSAVLLYGQGSQSTSVLVQWDQEITAGLEMRLAYKYIDAKENFVNGLSSAYQIPTHRAFANLGYSPGGGWKMDATMNWFGPKTLPSTEGYPVEWQRERLSPDTWLVNLQVNKSWKTGWEVYIGMENVFDFRQKDPIIAPDDPYGQWFDSQYVWGPVFGRMTYIGFRFDLPTKG